MSEKIEVVDETDDKKLNAELAALAAEKATAFCQALPDEELEHMWQVATCQIGFLAAEKARRLGVKNPKIAIIAVDADADLGEMLSAHIVNPEELAN